MKLTVDILEDFINSFDLSGDVLSISNNGENTTLIVEKTFHARKGMFLTVDELEYKIVHVSNNESIEVVGVMLAALKYTVSNPKYFHGTPILTKSHINGAKELDKLPMVYLYEILREKDLNVFSTVRRESDLRLFFLDSANYDEWDTNNHYTKRLLGLNNLVDEFINKARKYRCCFELTNTDFTRINHVNWGVYVDSKGNKKRIFDDDLTGVELFFTLPIKNCK